MECPPPLKPMLYELGQGGGGLGFYYNYDKMVNPIPNRNISSPAYGVRYRKKLPMQQVKHYFADWSMEYMFIEYLIDNTENINK